MAEAPSTIARTPAPTGRRALALWCCVLTVAAFCQSPGTIAADTKIDLAIDPWGFLAGAWHLWSDNFPLGQLQNQAYGYLFPQGLFFALFSAAPAWIVQRAWWALVLCVGFLSFVRLAEQLRVGSPSSRITAGLLYALCPRILTTVGAISSEAWVVALAPWVIIPISRLLDASMSHRVRWVTVWRRALSSAVAVFLMGAVNATATAAAVLPAAIWLVFAGIFEGPVRRRAAIRFVGPWLVSLAAVTAWWVGPLLLLGTYSAPFTDYIESAGVTTRFNSLVEVIRGTDSWTSFVSTERQAGWALTTHPVLIVATGLIAAVGLAGLAMAGMPRRRPWLVVFVTGLIILCAATTPFAPFATQIRDILDGAGAPLRNVHKFDPLIRLPLAMGIAHLAGRLRFLGILTEKRPEAGPLAHGATPPLIPATLRARIMENLLHLERYPRAAATLGVVLIAIAATSPAWSGRLAPTGTFRAIPDYWVNTATWLNTNAASTRTLILPSVPFARQTWGLTRDEPLQPLADVPWVVRDAIPLVEPSAIRMLDGLDTRLRAGTPDATLADTLAQAGIGYVVLRHDLAPQALNPEVTAAVEHTLKDSPGLDTVAQFGHSTGLGTEIIAVTPQSTTAAGAATAPLIADYNALPVVAAAPETLPLLNEADAALAHRRGVDYTPGPRLLAAHTPDAPQSDLLGRSALQNVPAPASFATDQPMLREHNYGGHIADTSDILTDPQVQDEYTSANPVHDYPAPGGPVTSIFTVGGTVTDSSSASDAYGTLAVHPGHSVTSAVDRNPDTYWAPAHPTPGQWLTLTPTTALSTGSIRITTMGQAASLLVETDSGSATVDTTPGRATGIALPPGPASWIKITLLSSPSSFGLSEVELFTRDRGAKPTWTLDSDGTVDGDTLPAPDHDLGVDVTPRRIPFVATPKNARRWLFTQPTGQPGTTLTRMFYLDRAATVEVDSPDCRARIDTTLIDTCGDTVDLGSGFHTIFTDDTWVQLTSPDYTLPTTGASTSTSTSTVSGPLAPSTTDRILWIPESGNPGRQATVGGLPLTPTRVNGWQQAWIVPAGYSGDVSITFPADTTYQAWLRYGFLSAGIAVALWLTLVCAHRVAVAGSVRNALPYPHNHDFSHHLVDPANTFTDVISSRFPQGVKATLLSITLGVTAVLVASWPGVVVAFGVLGVHAGIMWRAGHIVAHRASVVTAATATALAAIVLSYHPWPTAGAAYAGASWVPQLLSMMAIGAIFTSHVIPFRPGGDSAPGGLLDESVTDSGDGDRQRDGGNEDQDEVATE